MTSAPRIVGERLDGTDEIVGPVVDGQVRAQARQASALTLPDGDDHGGAERLAELDRNRADTGAAAMDEERLARLELAAVEDIRPHGEEGFRAAPRPQPCRTHPAGAARGSHAPRSTRHSRRRARARSPGRRRTLVEAYWDRGRRSCPATSRPGNVGYPPGGGGWCPGVARCPAGSRPPLPP